MVLVAFNIQMLLDQGLCFGWRYTIYVFQSCEISSGSRSPIRKLMKIRSIHTNLICLQNKETSER